LYKLKYCSTCRIYRPPRSVHCDDCSACIERLDHHCPWVGNCIGKRNYSWFLAFVNVSALLVIYSFGMAIWNLKKLADNFKDSSNISEDEAWRLAMRESPYSMILLGIALVFGAFIFTLCGYHHYLLCANNTTNENLKKTFTATSNPFKQKYFDNLNEICSIRGNKMLWSPSSEALIIT